MKKLLLATTAFVAIASSTPSLAADCPYIQQNQALKQQQSAAIDATNAAGKCDPAWFTNAERAVSLLRQLEALAAKARPTKGCKVEGNDAAAISRLGANVTNGAKHATVFRREWVRRELLGKILVGRQHHRSASLSLRHQLRAPGGSALLLTLGAIGRRKDTGDVAAGRAFIRDKPRLVWNRSNPDHLFHWGLTTRARNGPSLFQQIGHDAHS